MSRRADATAGHACGNYLRLTGMSLYLVRHTPVALPKGVCYGWLDAPLSEEYPRYAQQIIAELREIRLDKIYSSPSLRCVVLAEAIALTKGLTIRQDERLRELNFGAWEGLTWQEVYEQEAGRAWFADYWHAKTAGGESHDDLLARVADFEQERNKGSETLLVTHAGVIRAYRILLGKLSPSEAMAQEVNFGEIYQYE